MREWKRVLLSPKLLALLAFLLALNLALTYRNTRWQSANMEDYLAELSTYQSMEPAQALAQIEAEEEYWQKQFVLYDYLHPEEAFFDPWESCVWYFGEDFEQQIEEGTLQLDPLLADGEQAGYDRSNLLSQYRQQIEYLVEYPQYLDTVHANAKQLAVLSIFGQAGSFSSRNIEKTDKDFPQSVEIKLDNDYAMTAFASDQLCGYSLLVFILAVVLCFLEERKRGLWSLIHGSPNGRRHLAAHRAFILLAASVAGTLVLYGGKLLMLNAAYQGMGDLSRNIQSIAVFRDVPWVMTVGQFLTGYMILHILGIWLVGLALWAILQAVNHLPLAIGAASVFLAVEYTAFKLIPDSYAIVFLRFINIFAVVDIPAIVLHYLNVNFFGYPVQGFLLSLGLIPPLLLVLFVGNLLLAERKKPVSRQNPLLGFMQKIRVPFSKLVGRLRLFGMELYKILWLQKGIVVILALGIYAFGMLTTAPVDNRLYDPQLAGLTASMQGPITQEVVDEIDAKIAEYSTWDQSEAIIRQLDILNQLRDKATQSLHKGDGVWFMNQAGPSALMNQNVGGYQRTLALILLLAICLMLPGTFAAERQNRMSNLLRGVPNGRGVLWGKKIGAAYLCTVLAYIVFEAGELSHIFGNYGVFPLSAPIQSVDYFAESGLGWTVGGGLAVFLCLRLIPLLLAATMVLLVSQLCKQNNTALLIGSAVVLLPACLSYMGITELDFLGIITLFSPMEARLWQYAVAAAFIPVLLMLHYRLWVGYREGKE